MERFQLLLGRLLTVRLDGLKREDGQGVTEYGIALGFVAVVVSALLFVTLKTPITDFIGRVGTAIDKIAP